MNTYTIRVNLIDAITEAKKLGLNETASRIHDIAADLLKLEQSKSDDNNMWDFLNEELKETVDNLSN